MMSTGLVIYPEDEFEYAKERLVECCDDDNVDKLELYKFQDGTYRISCSNCCAVAEGSTILEAINNYEFGNFTVSPM